MEIWKPINGMKYYECSNFGRVRNTRTNHILAQTVNKYGYVMANMSEDMKRRNMQVHRIVASLFVDNPECKPYVNHKDGNKVNNNYLNLEWCTHSENMHHASSVLKRDFGRKNSKKVRCIETGVIYNSGIDAEKSTNIWNSHISQCCTGKRKTAGGYHFEYV